MPAMKLTRYVYLLIRRCWRYSAFPPRLAPRLHLPLALFAFDFATSLGAQNRQNCEA